VPETGYWDFFLLQVGISMLGILTLLGVSRLLFKRAHPAVHGVLPGLGFALLSRAPSNWAPIWNALGYGTALALVFLLVSVVRLPRRARLPEALVGFSIMALWLLVAGPDAARMNATRNAEYACNRALESDRSNTTGPADRHAYCECLEREAFAACGGLSLVWDQAPLERCKQEYKAGGRIDQISAACSRKPRPSAE
jgi:hypothetical protein